MNLSRALRSPAVPRAAQLLVGVLLGWAALSKLGEIPELARSIHNLRIVPVAGENVLAIVLPWIELMTALSLLLGIRARAGALLAASFMAIFTLAIALALVRGLNIECGCFGTASAGRVGMAKLLENIGIFAGATLGSIRQLPPASYRRVEPVKEGAIPSGARDVTAPE